MNSKTLYISSWMVSTGPAKDFDIFTPNTIELIQFSQVISSYNSIVIECEFPRDEEGYLKKRTELYGIKYAQRLRQKGFAGKILFLSFLSNSQILELDPKNTIINAIGHRFCRLPVSQREIERELEKINTLSEIELYDIQSNYCNRTGIAQELLHRLHGITNVESFNLDYIKNEIRKSSEIIGTLFQRDVNQFIDKLSFDDIRDTLNEVDSYFNQIINAQKEENFLSIEEVLNRSWSILFLDDEIRKDHSLVLELSEKVENVYCFSNYKLAEEQLERNIKQGLKINLVISDYRLLVSDGEVMKHQAKQGYKFLMETAETYPYIGLVALSSLPRKFLIQSFKRMGIKTSIYSKKDYLVSEKTINRLVEELLEIGDECFNAHSRHLKLSSPQWNNFEPFYNFHRNSLDYRINESYISNKASAYCRNFMDGNKSFQLKNYTTELKGKTKVPENPKSFQEYLEKMVCRRAVLWYSQYGDRSIKYSPQEVVPFLQGVNYNPLHSIETASNQVNTNLALRLTDFPWNATWEEREWLINSMHIDRSDLEYQETVENKVTQIVKDGIGSTKIKFQPTTITNSKLLITQLFKSSIQKQKADVLMVMIEGILQKIKHLEAQHKSTKSVKQFIGYLSRIKSQLVRILNAKKSGPLPADLDKVKGKVISRAEKKFSYSDELIDGLEVSAILFFAELKDQNKTYQNIDGFAEAFFQYHKESMGYVNPFVTLSFDKYTE